MYKNSENGAKFPISTKYAVEERHGGHHNGDTGNVRCPVVQFWETASGQHAWDNSVEL